MKKYLICDLPWGGFGAILDRRIVVAKIAEDYGRRIIFRIGDHQYDEPFENDHFFDKFDEKILDFNYSQQEDSIVYFNHQHWLDKIWIPSKKKRIPFVDGKILNSFKLKDSYQKNINQTLEKYPSIRNSIALHIRRGDKSCNITGHGSVVSAESLVHACLNIINAYGKKTVYLNSHSIDAIHEIGKVLNQHKIEYFYDEDEIRYNDKNWKIVLDNPDLKIQETTSSIKVIYTMSECFHVIGANNVQFPKLSSYLLSYRSNGTRGFTYVDWETEKISYTIK